MKTILFIIIGLSLLLFCNTGYCNGNTDIKVAQKTMTQGEKSINIASTPELYPLAKSWAEQYSKLNPAIKITITNFTEAQKGSALSFISDYDYTANSNQTNWKMVIGRDVVVAVVNAKNPMLNLILSQGVSTSKFGQFFADPQNQNWAKLIRGGQSLPVKYYVTDNQTLIGNIVNFTKPNPAAVDGIKCATSGEVISAVQKDVYAIGFCQLADLKESNSKEIITSLKILPIDKNGNGRIDNFENIYSNMDSFTRGVWIGKYPNALCGNIYVSASTIPSDKKTLDFLAWLMADGRQYLTTYGYSALNSSKIQANLASLGITQIEAPQTKYPPVSHPWLIILAVLGIASIFLPMVFGHSKRSKVKSGKSAIPELHGLNENSIMAPKGLYFDKTHTWAFMEKNGNVKVGIDDFLQHVTGTITRIKLKEVGDKVRKGEKILTVIRNGKQLNIYAPISGIIREQNQTLINDSWLVNSSPYSEGWVYLIEPKNWTREIQFMLMGEKYKEWLKNEFVRLRDFMAESVRMNSVVYAHVVLQDGGELTDNVLADLGPEVWEDFQTQFIDASK